MTTPRQHETRGGLAFLLSEAAGHRSRGTVTLKAGRAYAAGQVLAAVDGRHTLPDAQAEGAAATPVAILACDVDATAADTEAGVIDRDAEVDGDLLVWPEGLDADARSAGEAALADGPGIRVRR